MKKHLSYLAGYIDGDGCFFLQKITNPIKYRAKLIISTTSTVQLDFFTSAFGGHAAEMRKYNVAWKTQFHWYMSGKNAMELSQNLLPFLVEKKLAAKILIKFVTTKTQKEKYRKKMSEHRYLNSHITKEVFEDVQKTRFSGIRDEIDYCYLAGFIDAECCFYISKYKPKNRPNHTYKISLCCNNTSPNIFYWFMERLGGSLTFLARNEKNPKHRNQISWILSGNKLSQLLPKIYPYLIAKKAVCEKLMKFYKTTLPNGGDRHSQEFKDAYNAVLAEREKIVCEVHQLNSKGVKNV